MPSWDRHSKPDERKQRVGKPVHPAQTVDCRFFVDAIIHPHIEKLIDTQTRDVVRLEAISLELFSGNIEVSFEWCDTPTQWSIRDHFAAAAKLYAYIFHWVDSRSTKSMLLRSSAAQ